MEKLPYEVVYDACHVYSTEMCLVNAEQRALTSGQSRVFTKFLERSTLSDAEKNKGKRDQEDQSVWKRPRAKHNKYFVI